mmetsp:Transcript_635/g.1872  ORF Transcript_635/g.1872 Transcript_635/m.1872 type:complete len:212 (-) Transcript_635:56-691(-)
MLLVHFHLDRAATSLLLGRRHEVGDPFPGFAYLSKLLGVRVLWKVRQQGAGRRWLGGNRDNLLVELFRWLREHQFLVRFAHHRLLGRQRLVVRMEELQTVCQLEGLLHRFVNKVNRRSYLELAPSCLRQLERLLKNLPHRLRETMMQMEHNLLHRRGEVLIHRTPHVHRPLVCVILVRLFSLPEGHRSGADGQAELDVLQASLALLSHHVL